MRTPSVNNDIAIKKIRRFHQRQRRLPTYEEMQKLFNFASKRSGFLMIERLMKVGVIEKDTKGRITLKRSFLPLPVLGSIRAGYPDAEEEQLIDKLTFDEYLVDRPESSFLLKVRGDSMAGAGIQEKDIVIVDKNKTPVVGDIVVAFIDNEYTLKYLQKKDGKICLVPANSKYPTIYPKDSLTIEGVVISAIRRYKQ